MADSNGKDNQASNRPSHPPPPCDPFARYQTPWPRTEKDEQNPFVQFRRFADEQFQSFFSGIPNFFATFSSNADNWQQEVQKMTRQRHELEEGFRKHFEQDLEEQRQALKKLRQWHEEQIQQAPQEPQAVKADTQQPPWWSKGEAAKCPALNEMRSDNARNCPAMFDKDGKAKTELDAYQTMHEIDMKRMQAHNNELEAFGKVDTVDNARKITEILDNQRKETKLADEIRLAGLGWDGKQRQQSMAPSTSPSKPSQNDARTTKISRFSSRWSNPFDNPHDTIPWLLVNPYSPVFLGNPDQPRVGHVKLQQGVNQPFHIVDTFYIPRGFFQLNDRREELSKKLPWADAFEDLVSLQQTGKMVDRTYSTYRTPKTWIHDMVNRGSLGPTWGFNEAGQLTKLLRESQGGSAAQQSVIHPRDYQMQLMLLEQESMQRLRMERQKQDHKIGTPNAWETDVNPGFVPPLPTPEEVISAGVIAATSNANQDLKQLEQDTMKEVASPSSQPTPSEEEKPVATVPEPAQSSWSSTTWSSSSSGLEDQKSDSIISSTTTTERWTRPDGTVETKRVFKRRYSDGREIEEETHNLEEPKAERRQAMTLEQAPWPVGPKETNATIDDKTSQRGSDKQTQTVTPVQDELVKEKKRSGGWFWH